MSTILNIINLPLSVLDDWAQLCYDAMMRSCESRDKHWIKFYDVMTIMFYDVMSIMCYDVILM